MLLDDGSRKYVWGLGLAYAVDTAGTVEVYHTDGLGSVRAITDAAGTVIQTYQTDEFGIPTQTSGSSGQPFGYTGERRDGETGFVYLRARLYDPASGRFLQRDPVPGVMNQPSSLHRYAYVQNNPVNAADPSGLWAVGFCMTLDGGVGFWGNLSGCYVVTDRLQVGGTATLGGGAVALAKVGLGPSVLISNAEKVEDLGSWSACFGGSISEGIVPGVDVSLTTTSDGRQVGAVNFSTKAGATYLPPAVPAEFHGGACHTWTAQTPPLLGDSATPRPGGSKSNRAPAKPQVLIERRQRPVSW